MALIKCKECGKEISSTAFSCPHCGIEMRSKKKSNGIVFDIIIIVSLIVYTIGKLYWDGYLDFDNFKYLDFERIIILIFLELIPIMVLWGIFLQYKTKIFAFKIVNAILLGAIIIINIYYYKEHLIDSIRNLDLTELKNFVIYIFTTYYHYLLFYLITLSGKRKKAIN